MQNSMKSNAIAMKIIAAALLVLAWTTQAVARAPLYDEQRGVLTIAPLLETATPAVVSVAVASRASGADNPLQRDPFFRRFFGLPETDREGEPQVMSAGSGVIIDARQGHVLTNHHVVANAERITVTVKDGRQFKAKLIGSDEATDVALLQIEATNLTGLALGDSDQLKVGDVVLAIGNPFGLGQTVTSGIISALGRAGLAAERYESFIQTDAPINPGNSGGALINTKGELIGINTAIIAPSGGNVGIGFAVPSNMVRSVVEQLLKHGEVRRGRIGIAVQSLTPDIATALGAPVQRGAVIGSVDKGSPAELAGLKAGDIITTIDGLAVADANDVRNRIGLRERGATVELSTWRAGKSQIVSVKVGEQRTAAAVDVRETASQLAGSRFTDLPENHPAKGKVTGALTADVQVGSPAWRLGLRNGDIIVAVNQRAIRSAAELADATKNNHGVLTLNILRGDLQLFIVAQG